MCLACQLNYLRPETPESWFISENQWFSESYDYAAAGSVINIIADGAYSRWNANLYVGTPTFVTFNFMSGVASYDTAANRPGFTALTVEQQFNARAALAAWSAVSGIVFVEAAPGEGADLRFGAHDFSTTTNSWASGYAYYPSVSGNNFSLLGGDIWMNTARYGAQAYTGAAYHTLLHEIGHAIGLKHPFDAPNADSTLTTADTVMAYNGNRQAAPQALDILAARYLYGVGPVPYFWDYGNQTLTIYGAATAESLQAIGFNTIIAAGGGDDIVMGRAGNDWLFGGNGNDTISGGGGGDVLYGDLTGEAGSDNLKGEDGNDILIGGDLLDILDGGNGDDWMFGGNGSDSATGGAGNDVFYGDLFAGEAGNDLGVGQAGNDVLIGGEGNDVLYGGFTTYDTGSGDDWLFGSSGSDTLYGQDGNDVLYGDLFSGEVGNDVLNGGTGNDFLWGGAGSDFLYGAMGTDQLYGGSDTDTFIFKSSGETNRDVIYDFATGLGGDILDLRGTGFSGMTLAAFKSSYMRDSFGNAVVDFDGSGTTYEITILNTSVANFSSLNILLA